MRSSATSGDYTRSRYNSLQYGVMLHHVLPSRGEECIYDRVCPIRRSRRKSACAPGSPCPWELHLLEEYVQAARREYGYAKAWLDQHSFEDTILRLGILSLQTARLASRIGNDGLTENVTKNGKTFMRETIAVSRYGTALANRREKLFARLLPPDDWSESL